MAMWQRQQPTGTPARALIRRAAVCCAAAAACAAACAAAAALSALAGTSSAQRDPVYGWRPAAAAGLRGAETLESRLPPPPGFSRVEAPAGSFSAWLRGLPMKPQGAPVLLYTGVRKARQDVHAAVVDIDTGTRDLQQCADAIMRLRAEWLWSRGRRSEIAFNDSEGRRMTLPPGARSDYAAFRSFMIRVFAYAGTYSLERELKPVPNGEIAAGDVFIRGGFPGHAVLVVDVAASPSGERRFLLAQSFMPAQEIHILKVPGSADGSAWYAFPVNYPLLTPEWTFPAGSLRRWL